MSNRYLVSGISPGPAGVGRVLEYLIVNSKNVIFIYPPSSRIISFKESLLKFEIVDFVKCFLFFIRDYYKLYLFRINIYMLRNKDVVILHPQSIGYKNVQRLILRNRVTIYVMDNSFFCVKSYNYLNSSEKACILCLNLSFKNAQTHNCVSFPIEYSYDEYFYFLNFLKENKKQIKFITQNKGQIDLLKKQFGDDIIYSEMGLLTSDMFEDSKLLLIDREKKYDIVFHGDETLAKGGKYIFEIAKRLPEYTFLFPFNTILAEVPENVDFIKMNWTTGLKEYVFSSKLTLCPSIWSAPIEGSVVKTLKLGVALGVFESEFSFSNELPDAAVLKLSGNIEKDVELVKRFISSEDYKKVRIKGKNFIEGKISSMIIDFDKKFKV